jgi:hypothetical protein
MLENDIVFQGEPVFEVAIESRDVVKEIHELFATSSRELGDAERRRRC